MNMTENARLALGLRALGMNDTDIVNFLLWIETGEEQYKPKSKDEYPTGAGEFFPGPSLSKKSAPRQTFSTGWVIPTFVNVGITDIIIFSRVILCCFQGFEICVRIGTLSSLSLRIICISGGTRIQTMNVEKSTSPLTH